MGRALGKPEDGFRLGSWVVNQRNAFLAGKLSTARTAQLDAVPGWAWTPRRQDWEEGFTRLASYVQREGHARVSQDHLEDGFRLGGWVATQRQRYRQHKLDATRSARLEALRGWSWDPHGAAWERGFAHLLRFVEHEGHSAAPSTEVEDSFQLGRWVQKQRQAFQRGRLASERICRLEALPGWVWSSHKG